MAPKNDKMMPFRPEDIDLDRVVNDPLYRRWVIDLLNGVHQEAPPRPDRAGSDSKDGAQG